MANLRNNTPMPGAGRAGENRQAAQERWMGELTPGGGMPMVWPGEVWRQNDSVGQNGAVQFRGAQMGQGNRQEGLSMSHDLPSEVVESPVNLSEAYLGSLKAMLNRNKGNYIVATFLIGTQNLVSWEGVLYDVGNDYVTIYQPGRDRYVVIDMYSLKYIEFYDTRRQELCDRMMQERGWTDRP